MLDLAPGAEAHIGGLLVPTLVSLAHTDALAILQSRAEEPATYRSQLVQDPEHPSVGWGG